MKKNLILLLIIIISLPAIAAKRYWIAASTSNWKSTSNWSASSGGGGGSSVPGSSGTAYFNSGGSGNCTVNEVVNVKRFDVESSYTGTISQGIYSVAIGTGNAVFNGGTFSGGSAGITISGALTISGTAFTSKWRRTILAFYGATQIANFVFLQPRILLLQFFCA